ncbi:MAG: hypothetical protein KME50_17425 [Nostoc desertorum CM1-VF14]|nr:hypothetical protein [Nostoc desertorum CM1-VF14]
MRYQENGTAQRLHEEWFTICLSTSTNRQLLTQRCRISPQATYSVRSSLLYETLRERYNWLVIY